MPYPPTEYYAAMKMGQVNSTDFEKFTRGIMLINHIFIYANKN